MAFYIEGEVVDAESITVRFRSVETDTEVFLEELNFPYKEEIEEVDSSKVQVHLQLVVSVQEVKFDAPGKYALEYSFDGEDWVGIRDYMLLPQENVKQDK
nr:hypothetical protein [Yoonia maricola]